MFTFLRRTTNCFASARKFEKCDNVVNMIQHVAVSRCLKRLLRTFVRLGSKNLSYKSCKWLVASHYLCRWNHYYHINRTDHIKPIIITSMKSFSHAYLRTFNMTDQLQLPCCTFHLCSTIRVNLNFQWVWNDFAKILQAHMINLASVCKCVRSYKL